MQAIRTRFLCATNYKGSRITARAEAGSVTLSYDHALNSDENHRAACDALRQKYEWTGQMVSGEFAGDTYWVFV